MYRLALILIKNFWRLPWAYGKLCHYAKYTDKFSEEEKYAHIQYMLKQAIRTGNIDFQVYGKENIPKKNGFLIYANHQGMFDILAIVASCDQPLAAVLKKELCKIKFLRLIVKCTNSFPMDREDIKQSLGVIQSVIKEVKKGRNYLIFPEGTRSRKGNQMLEFHGGSFKCATKSKAPILPVALIDSYKVLDKKGNKKVSVQIHYLKPIPYEEYQDLNTLQLAELVHKRIEDTIKENE